MTSMSMPERLALTSSLRTGRGVTEHFRPQEETPLGHHDLPGLYPAPNGDAVATQRPHPHGACDKLPLLIWGRDEDDLPLADGLHRAAWEHDSAFTTGRRECQGHIHTQSQPPLSVWYFHSDL